MENQNNEFTKEFTENGFWSKIKDYAKTAGKEVIEKALWLYYAFHAPNTPTWAKATILAALGYFISPLDAIPDLAPVVGYTDDLGVLAMAVATVSMHITDDVKKLAAEKIKVWFGE